MIRLRDKTIEPLLAMTEKELFTNFILLLHAHGIYEEKIDSSIILSIAF